MGAKTAILNGRISIRSINSYLKLRPFFSPLLKQVDAFSMISSDDAERIKALGADPARIHVNGNAKYDQLAARVDPTLKKEMQNLLNLDKTQRLFVAGSTRAGEEDMILEAYGEMLKQYPDLLLAIAPRHIQRTPEIETYLKRRGLQYQIRSQMRGDRPKRTSPIVIFNTFGELFQLYSVATIVFCGGSLVPLGGQNPLEPAVWGKVVLYGPHMDHFLDARSILEKAGAGITVTDASTLAEKALWYLDRPDTMAVCGAAAAEAVRGNEKSAEKHAAVLLRLLRH
jgi:3-deoxy-D-manno-octulosonic-acid transferase